MNAPASDNTESVSYTHLIEGTLGCMAVESLFPETHVFLRNVERLGMIT